MSIKLHLAIVFNAIARKTTNNMLNETGFESISVVTYEVRIMTLNSSVERLIRCIKLFETIAILCFYPLHSMGGHTACSPMDDFCIKLNVSTKTVILQCLS